MNLAAYGEADAWTRPLDGFASISEGTVYTILQCIYIIQYTKTDRLPNKKKSRSPLKKYWTPFLLSI